MGATTWIVPLPHLGAMLRPVGLVEGGKKPPSPFSTSSLGTHSPQMSPPKPEMPPKMPPQKCHPKRSTALLPWHCPPALGGEWGSQGPSLPSHRLGRCGGSPQRAPRLGLSPQSPSVLGRASGAKAEEPRGAAAQTCQPWAPTQVGAELVPAPLPAAAHPLGWAGDWGD